jgi:putative transposase
VRRACKFRVYPTAGQAARAAMCLRDHQRLYNGALEERREAWRMRKVSVGYGQHLRIASMTRSASGTPEQPGANVAAKSGLNRSVLDAGWGQFTSILAAKAAEAGRRIVLVDPRNTSITCHQCGHRCQRPWQALVICPVHGGMDADVNAARNIYARAGLGSGQADAA